MISCQAYSYNNNNNNHNKQQERIIMEASNHHNNNTNIQNNTDSRHNIEESIHSNPSRDVVDFVAFAANNNNHYADNKLLQDVAEQQPPSQYVKQQHHVAIEKIPRPKLFSRNKQTSKEIFKKNDDPKKSAVIKEKNFMFSFGKSRGQKSKASLDAEEKANNEETKEQPTSTIPSQAPLVPIGTPPRQHKFVKSSSISRLLANTYNAKKFEKEEKKRQANDTKFHTYGGRRRGNGPYLERFKQRCAKEEGDVASTQGGLSGVTGSITLTTDSRDLYGGSRNELASVEDFKGERHEDLGAKAMRTLSRGLGKLLRKRTHSVEISTPDPEFKVSYLGNVLTGWAKGEGCVEKQLNTLWRNYTQNNKPDVIMRIKVCASGLKATTRQHGLTEYWANRITHCCAPKNYPRIFCWIYRHEGRKMKHELRCHAVLCSKEKTVQEICSTLKENLERALLEFKKEKIHKQNARLSLANAADDNPSLPRRKILLSVGGNNYRPPLERSKSAPKLMAIEEAIGEEEGEEAEETNEPEMPACCQKDSLYPAMTLGRRRCRRGHSIRRTGKAHAHFEKQYSNHCCHLKKETKEEKSATHEEQRLNYGSNDSDDFEKLLKGNNYDLGDSLSNELLPYFDMQLHKNTSCSLGSLSDLKDDANDEEPLSLLPSINSDPRANPHAEFTTTQQQQNEEEEADLAAVGLRRNGVCSDGEEDYFDDEMYFRQAAILTMLHRNSMRKMAQLSLSSEENSLETTNNLGHHQTQSSISSNASSTANSISSSSANSTSNNTNTLPDSDEGSISSGCETASTVTANQDDLSLKYLKGLPLQLGAEYGLLNEEPLTAEKIYQRLQERNNGNETNFSSSSSITLKMEQSPSASLKDLRNASEVVGIANRSRRNRRLRAEANHLNQEYSDSECSDESGYVEFQDREKSTKTLLVNANGAMDQQKPILPPKPAIRKLLLPPKINYGGSPTI